MLDILMHAGMNTFGVLGFRIPMKMDPVLNLLLVLLIDMMLLILYKVDRSNNDTMGTVPNVSNGCI